MEWTTIGGMVARHLLTTASGWLMTHGLLAADGSGNEAFIGAGMFFAGLAWSAWQKWGKVLVNERLLKDRGVHPDTVK